MHELTKGTEDMQIRSKPGEWNSTTAKKVNDAQQEFGGFFQRQLTCANISQRSPNLNKIYSFSRIFFHR